MESQELKARIFTPASFYRHLKIFVASFSEFRKSRKNGNVSKSFSEKIMLAVTQVNGCRYCNYVHTKNAVDAGTSVDEIKMLLNGELGELDNDESVALMFAQHYADTNGKPDKETYTTFVEHYGEQKAVDILAMIKVIMVANIHGISLDAFLSRFKGKQMKGSKLKNELGIALGVLVLLPTAIIKVWFEKRVKNSINENRNKMKTIKNMSIIVLATSLLLGGGTSFAQNLGKTNKKNKTDYNVISRLDVSPRPAGFTPVKATPKSGAYIESVVTTSNRVLNSETIMLKKASVQPIGEKGNSPWEFLCDEGGHTYEQSALNPLSYMVGGISSSLLTRVEQAIKIMNLDVVSAKVEAKVFYRYDDPFTPKWIGYTDKVVANILIKSDEPTEKIAEVKRMAVQAWAVGECLMNETPVEAKYTYNTNIWDAESASSGKVIGSESYDNGLKITSKVEKPKPESFELGTDVSMEKFTNPFKFEVVSISESANDKQRPYLHKITIKAIQENYATWNVYADDSRGYKGIDKAPTSTDYFTSGTTLCLMSQLTGSSEVFKHKGIEINDYRAEHQFNYQVDNYMTPSATGHVDSVTTRILVKSNTSEKVMSDFASLALRMCFAGEAVTGATTTEIGVYQNGNLIK
ncbi:alkylhydroperoxidase AhpD family core domain-containing protein [Lutibacter oricola]|uniref:Alkylhydroperoxidase AhpD family core domain-containing protein n=1 Tax=Lutibacter oricola TaxID=762486 RepID=A0A1H2WW62_9FLAO|nr:carboxymuconolactone decarboxylase family protein [Lutibacter oricola]SDW84484.1 alkylhydroperoxidase AhpD family core domain-containing protein [Lutibacter oricola]